VRAHARGPAAFGEGFRNRRIETRFERELAVRMPFVLRFPEARGHDDRHLVQLRRQTAAEADLLAERLHVIAHAGAPQPHVERSPERPGLRCAGARELRARSGTYGVVELALLPGEG